MKIDIVTPPVKGESFTGGLWCIFQYAIGLAERGHNVSVIPMTPSPRPTWLAEPFPFTYISNSSKAEWLRAGRNLIVSSRAYRKDGRDKEKFRDSVSSLLEASLRPMTKIHSFELSRSFSLSYLRRVLTTRSADITLATHFETVLPVVLYAQAKRAYFGQHFEPLFWPDYRGGEVSREEALLGYRAGIPIIANSSWLRTRILEENPRAHVELCLNAINHEHFNPIGDRRNSHGESELRVISYGGRGVRWKGFPEMAEAMSIARAAKPGTTFSWQVYGGADGVSEERFEDLGFLKPPQLGEAYRGADVLLSGSWYESFPLFPLEAMACGLATITTSPGTEDYALHEQNAEVVAPRDPEALAASLLRFADDREYARRIGARAAEDAMGYTWAKSIQRMEEVLLGLIQLP